MPLVLPPAVSTDLLTAREHMRFTSALARTQQEAQGDEQRLRMARKVAAELPRFLDEAEQLRRDWSASDVVLARAVVTPQFRSLVETANETASITDAFLAQFPELVAHDTARRLSAFWAWLDDVAQRGAQLRDATRSERFKLAAAETMHEHQATFERLAKS